MEIKENTDLIKKKNRQTLVLASLIIMPILVLLLSFTVGRYGISVPELFQIFYAKLFGLEATWEPTVETIVFKVRMPRILAAMLVGGALAIAGASYQGLFKNPMVSPDILGASAGAGFGAAVGILLSFGAVGIQVISFLFGMGAVALTYFISTSINRGNNATLVLVLTGMVVSTVFASFISLTKYVADPYSKLPAITFWLMGGLNTVEMKDLGIVIFPLLLGAVPLMLLRWKLNVMAFGDEEARALGLDVPRLRLVIIVCSTVLTATSVSVSGMIGWVGLVIPHLARMITGPNYNTLLTASMLIGSTFLLVVDNVARSAFAMEIPLGILTSLIGAPFFVYLLFKGKRGWI